MYIFTKQTALKIKYKSIKLTFTNVSVFTLRFVTVLPAVKESKLNNPVALFCLLVLSVSLIAGNLPALV